MKRRELWIITPLAAAVYVTLMSVAGCVSSGNGPPTSEPAIAELNGLSFLQAREAATHLGHELASVRRAVAAELSVLGEKDKVEAYEAAMGRVVGSASDTAPSFLSTEARLVAVSNWGATSPYPTIAIDLTSGDLFIHDAGVSPKWFGPFRPRPSGRVHGSFTNEDEVSMLSTIIASLSSHDDDDDDEDAGSRDDD